MFPTAFKTPIQTKNNKPAYRATLKLYKGNPSINLSTMLMEFPYPISRIISNNHVFVPGKCSYQFVSPIIANKTHIFGIDVFNRETFIDWTFNHYEFMRSNTSSLNMKIKPIKDVNISYIIMEANTSSFLEAMEVWHQAFPDLYGINPYGKSSIAISPNTTNWNSEMVTKYGGKLLWGSNNKYNKETKNFYEMNPFAIILYNDTNQKYNSKEYDLIKSYGVSYDNNGYYFALESCENYNDYLVVLSDAVREYHIERFKEMNNKYNFSGIAIRNFDTTLMGNICTNGKNYASYKPMGNIDSIIPYALLDGDDNETFNYQWGLLKLLEELHEYSPDGFLVECKNVHPQLAQYVGSVLYRMQNTEQYSAYTYENKIGL
ncbi:hypothetical protein TVAG_219960 [Trichomonas vaginalis G3]|uniref:Uncharacterized protein n=1 Tax=Trichomonas vaginalis (strain ATCC PRA-98 / G3) TaxID=412133 RepID=A2DXV2_TRIV3|nr:spectrin binding [Trichomonas vaginalis G3]EAY14812.1 hypothetical protein TVAG_219960 [Trichomonas vaginalis G3]KAI5508085.1 spectrin binding [Trichomonas vaginalis G3]|eukprot:XP_001327035.1 hypothetical protein [Trichomonas vaginalis G3]